MQTQTHDKLIACRYYRISSSSLGSRTPTASAVPANAMDSRSDADENPEEDDDSQGGATADGEQEGPKNAAEHTVRDVSPAAAGSQARQVAEAETPKRKRQPKPTIDIDEHIERCRKGLKEARKAVAAAKAEARNEKRRKQRVIKKAAALSLEDLERIAVLKRCGLYINPSTDASGSAASGASSASGSAARADGGTALSK